MYITLFNLHSKLVTTAVLPILEIRKLKLKEIIHPAQGHRVDKCWSWETFNYCFIRIYYSVSAETFIYSTGFNLFLFPLTMEFSPVSLEVKHSNFDRVLVTPDF